MARRVTIVPAAVLRSVLARSILGTLPSSRLGTITLRRHQVAAVTRIQDSLRSYGGVLLADAVGVGKTYVALAAARDYEKPLVIAPAVLRSQWEQSCRASETTFRFTSSESLSRGPINTAPDIVIVDEAHHFRNQNTRRYQHLADLTATAPVVLLSATPVHNRREDLLSLLALFLGSRAMTLGADELGRCVIRREQGDVTGVNFPPVAGARRIVIPATVNILERIFALPPPVPAADGKGAAQLVRSGLAQLWASSDAALLAGISRRLTSGEALVESVRRGSLPTRRELTAWIADDNTLQLGFAEVLSAPNASADTELERAIADHLDALRALAGLVRKSGSRDSIRIDTVRRIRSAHPGERVVAFTMLASTARSTYEALAGSGKVALVTGRGARIASGRLPTDEVLRMFKSPAHPREAIDLLVATDLLSEGVDLPEASVIVHMDLPWTPARLEQRLGRLRRVRTTNTAIASYVFAQPVAVERRMRRERLLVTKAMASAGVTGTDSVPAWAQPIGRHVRSVAASPASSVEALHRIVAGWLNDDPAYELRCRDRIAVAGCTAPERGALLLLESKGEFRLLAITAQPGKQLQVTLAPHSLVAAAHTATTQDAVFTSRDYLVVRSAVERFLRVERVRRLAASDPTLPGAIVELMGRLGSVLARLSLHDRARLAPRISRLRESLAGRLTAGLERKLCESARHAGTADEIIDRFETILAGRTWRSREASYEIRAVLLFIPGPSS